MFDEAYKSYASPLIDEGDSEGRTFFGSKCELPFILGQLLKYAHVILIVNGYLDSPVLGSVHVIVPNHDLGKLSGYGIWDWRRT